MNRRRFIASLGGSALLGGCIGGGNDGRVEASFSTDSDPVPIGFNAVVGVSVNSDGTTEQPPTLSIELENTASGDRSIAVENPTVGLPFDDTVGEGPDGAEIGLTDDAGELDFDECWKGAIGGDGDAEGDRLAAGEEMEADRFLYVDEGSDGCWEPGDYRFEQEYRMGNPEEDLENWESYTWGFTVTVSTE